MESTTLVKLLNNLMQKWTMLGIYIGIAVLAVIIVILFVDNLPSELVEKETDLKKGTLKMLAATVYHLRHKEQLVLIPLTMYSGFEQASYNAEFTSVSSSCLYCILSLSFMNQ